MDALNPQKKTTAKVVLIDNPRITIGFSKPQLSLAVNSNARYKSRFFVHCLGRAEMNSAVSGFKMIDLID